MVAFGSDVDGLCDASIWMSPIVVKAESLKPCTRNPPGVTRNPLLSK